MATPADDDLLHQARALDAADPLGPFRDRFATPDPDVVYFDGNSLGRPPNAALEAARRVGERWADDLIRGWEGGAEGALPWLNEPLRVGARLAPVLGCAADEVVIADSTTVNLYRLASAALDARVGRRTVVVERSEFPTDRY